MKRYGHILVLLGALLFVAAVQKTACAADAGVRDVVATLEQGYKLLHDVQADFSQRAVMASIKKEQRGNGTLFIKKPAGATAMFRFNYTKPAQQIVSNGKSVWFYLPDNNQVMVSDAAGLFDAQNGITLSYLTGMEHVSKDFTTSLAGNGRDHKGNYVLELVPKKKNRVIARLQLTIAAQAVEQYLREGKGRDPFPLISSVVTDPFGNRTTMDFSRVKVNRGLGNSLFKFKVPRGAEVIRR